MIRLTERAHEIVHSILSAGETAIDATAGNGHDTRFLSELVGPTGRVFAFDLQPEALARTTELLGHASNVVLVQLDHARMREAIPTEFHGRVRAIMFNLGYLPGGDKTVVTQTQSTVEAVEASVRLLLPGGVLTIVAYTGHPGGREETEAVDRWLGAAQAFGKEVFVGDSTSDSSPRLFVLHKRLANG